MNAYAQTKSLTDAALSLFCGWLVLSIPTTPIFPLWLKILIGAGTFIGLRSLLNTIVDVQEWSLRQVIAGLVGAIFGLIVANLIIVPAIILQTTIADYQVAGSSILSLLSMALFSKLFIRYEPAILQASVIKTAGANTNMLKLLDSNALIDGRISKLAKIRFVEGLIIIPGFVLDEIKRIADDNDELKRQRGRTALKTAKQMIDELDYVVLYDTPPATDVDQALIRLAAELNAKIITSDANLIDVAAVQKIPVVNINELSEALQMIYLRGEKLKAKIIEAGNNPGQGVAYTEDGTMIVVTNGEEYIGEKVSVVITRHLQSKYGIVLFADIAQ